MQTHQQSVPECKNTKKVCLSAKALKEYLGAEALGENQSAKALGEYYLDAVVSIERKRYLLQKC